MTIERTADLGTTYADRVLREAQAAATGGLGPEQAQRSRQTSWKGSKSNRRPSSRPSMRRGTTSG